MFPRTCSQVFAFAIAVALFAASDEASYLTGTDIVVDGGMLSL